MKEKRLSDGMFTDIERAAKIYERIQGWQARLLIREIRRLREALARVRAVWEDVHDETSIVGIIDNALGMEK